MKKLSIVIPVYNIAEYINECLDSILKVYNEDMELIIVNDGSTDNVATILANYKKKYKDIKIITQSNKGLSCTRNVGLKNATGKYIIFIDGDDVIVGKILYEMMKNADENNSDIVFGGYYEFGKNMATRPRPDKTKSPPLLNSKNEILKRVFKIDISFGVWNKMYNRQFLVKNKFIFLENYWFEDLDFGFKTFYYAKIITNINKTFYGYRQRSNSISKTFSVKMLDKLVMMEKIKNILKKENDFEFYKKGYNALYIKMFLSIFYKIMNIGNNSDEVYKVIEKIYTFEYMKTDINEDIIFNKYLKWKEKVVMNLFKYKIINKNFIKYMYKIYKVVK